MLIIRENRDLWITRGDDIFLDLELRQPSFPYDKYELNNTVERLFEEHRKKVIQKLRVVEGQVKLDTMTGLLNRKEFERMGRYISLRKILIL